MKIIALKNKNHARNKICYEQQNKNLENEK